MLVLPFATLARVTENIKKTCESESNESSATIDSPNPPHHVNHDEPTIMIHT